MESAAQESISNINININNGRITVAQSSLCNLNDRVIQNFWNDSINSNHSDHIGPNVNLKFPKKFILTQEQKEFFKSKIIQTKKTELCKNWILLKDCYFKDKCSFAHGEVELRKKTFNLYKKLKCKECKGFKDKSYCSFGSRCQYLHIVSDHVLLTYNKILERFAVELIKESFREENVDVEFYKLLEYIHFKMNSIFLM